ncbi:SDR family NAD(P)-dependent oxidoreductase [Mycobacterium talmoniae]|uniref:SDR family NAD(P)-dependent oxidoreductase n=1 Tax=Mycobacterium talmoniae TaxID=1858794 RepID=UPI0013F4E217|nr:MULTISPECIES: SDR family oxidoreductase [Mycobacterium]
MRPVRTPWNRALVTGASAGIGTAFARQLARRGTNLVLVARDETRLKSLADDLMTSHPVDVEVLPADLSDQASLYTVERRLRDGPFIDLLVNNAGIGTFGAFSSTDIDTEMRTIAVNVVAPVRLTRSALDRMCAAGRGTIITVSSIDALQPTPYHAVYGATKAFVNSLFSALHEETRTTPITSTVVMPGYVATEFTARAGLQGALERVPGWLMLTPGQVAAEALGAAESGKTMSVPGKRYKVPAALLSVLPHRLGRRIFAAIAPPH